MAKDKIRKDSDIAPDEQNAAVKAFQQRRAERMGANEPENTDDNETIVSEIVEAVAEVLEAVPATADEPDRVQLVRDRRDRRDADGDPQDLNGAMGVIAQQDEDIDTLLGIIDALKAANIDNEEKCDAEEIASGEEDEPAAENAERKDSVDDFRELLRVVRFGDKLNMDGLETMSVKSAKKAIIARLKPTMRLDGKSAAYVDAAFDMAVSEYNQRKDTNYQRKQIATRKDSAPAEKNIGSAAEARQRMIDKRMKKEDR